MLDQVCVLRVAWMLLLVSICVRGLFGGMEGFGGRGIWFFTVMRRGERGLGIRGAETDTRFL